MCLAYHRGPKSHDNFLTRRQHLDEIFIDFITSQTYLSLEKLFRVLAKNTTRVWNRQVRPYVLVLFLRSLIIGKNTLCNKSCIATHLVMTWRRSLDVPLGSRSEGRDACVSSEIRLYFSKFSFRGTFLMQHTHHSVLVYSWNGYKVQ